MTVLFADLSGYTAFAERMDPEAVKTLVDGALYRLGDEVDRFGGTVDKYIGDNVMALFGAPVAHEDDAERAVRAALGMQAAMEEVNERLPDDVRFDLRVGINTGEVLAGAIGRAYTVMGDTVNVASRLQSAARPGSVWVGEATMRATSGAIAYDELEPLELRGKSRPVAAWEATGLIAEHSLRRAGRNGNEAPLVGRDNELDALESLYDRVLGEGRPHLVTVVGEAGVGKSRLLREFSRRVTELDPSVEIRTGRCLPVRRRHRLLGARGDPAPGVRDRRQRLVRAGLVQAPQLLRPDDGHESRGLERGLRAQGRVHRALAGDRRAAGAGRVDGDDPERVREEFFSALRSGIEALAPDEPAGARVRGRPLGRRRHARRGRVPGAVGARSAPDCLPHPRRAARAAPDLGRGTRELDADVPRAAHARLHAGAGFRAAADLEARRRRPRRRGALGRQPAVRRGDRPADRRGRRRQRRRGAARHGPGRARRAARRARALRAPRRAAGRGGGTHVLGGLAAAARRRRGPRPAPDAANAPGQGHPRARRRGPAGGRARARVQARAHPRRRLRDAPEVGALAEALRRRQLHRAARR